MGGKGSKQAGRRATVHAGTPPAVESMAAPLAAPELSERISPDDLLRVYLDITAPVEPLPLVLAARGAPAVAPEERAHAEQLDLLRAYLDQTASVGSQPNALSDVPAPELATKRIVNDDTLIRTSVSSIHDLASPNGV